jgi:hypothetical protein
VNETQIEAEIGSLQNLSKDKKIDELYFQQRTLVLLRELLGLHHRHVHSPSRGTVQELPGA